MFRLIRSIYWIIWMVCFKEPIGTLKHVRFQVVAQPSQVSWIPFLVGHNLRHRRFARSFMDFLSPWMKHFITLCSWWLLVVLLGSYLAALLCVFIPFQKVTDTALRVGFKSVCSISEPVACHLPRLCTVPRKYVRHGYIAACMHACKHVYISIYR